MNVAERLFIPSPTFLRTLSEPSSKSLIAPRVLRSSAEQPSPSFLVKLGPRSPAPESPSRKGERPRETLILSLFAPPTSFPSRHSLTLSLSHSLTLSLSVSPTTTFGSCSKHLNSLIFQLRAPKNALRTGTCTQPPH